MRQYVYTVLIAVQILWLGCLTTPDPSQLNYEDGVGLTDVGGLRDTGNDDSIMPPDFHGDASFDDDNNAVPNEGRADVSLADEDIDAAGEPDYALDANAMEHHDAELPHESDVHIPSEPASIPERQPVGLPRIHDYTNAPEDHVDQLVRRALSGMGLDERTGPHELDRVFVGRWYMAWIDETGFYGKMNGLWALNGDPNNLDFMLKDGERPVNTFMVGEHGNGSWPGGYMGAEHIEFPNSTPEADDNPSCAQQGSFCAQYSHAEAPHYTDSDIPTWRACNDGSPSWDTHFVPVEVTATTDGLRLVYEGPITKEGDFGGSNNGNNCHADYLFPDGQRRPVFLRVGYDLNAETHHVDRLLQVRNPPGNPDFDGSFSFIGGFVMTAWPTPHHLKRLNRFARVEDSTVNVPWENERVFIEPNRWTSLPSSIPNHDVVLGWARQPVTLSAYSAFTRAQAYTLSNHGADNGDSGFCLCTVHGAIEMGGGLISVPVPGGSNSHLARRRLTIHHEDEAPQPRIWRYEAESQLSHDIGRADADGWSASTALDDRGYLAFGPYATDWGNGTRSATFRLMIDLADSRDETVVKLEIYDADDDEIITSRDVLRSDFNAAFEYHDFAIEFDTRNRSTHRFETRVYWRDISYVRLDNVTVRER